MTVVDSVAAVRLDEESGRLAGDHRVAHVRSVAVRVEHVDAAEAREQLLRVARNDYQSILFGSLCMASSSMPSPTSGIARVNARSARVTLQPQPATARAKQLGMSIEILTVFSSNRKKSPSPPSAS
jgi:hypothetical protein